MGLNTTVNTEAGNFSIRIEGRVMGRSEAHTLESPDEVRMLDLFKKVQVSYVSMDKKQVVYQPSVWEKSSGSQFDCIEIKRDIAKENTEVCSQKFQVVVKMWLDQMPQRYVLSEKLEKLLGIKEETRSHIVAALWQYIKQNRLQDTDDRRLINLNSELVDILNCGEKIEFHQLITLLNPHLQETEPLTLRAMIETSEPKNEYKIFDLSVQTYPQIYKKALNFLVDHNYQFSSNQDPSSSATDTKASSTLKKREQKSDAKMAEKIEKIARKHSQLEFYEQMSSNVKRCILNTIVQ